MPARPEHSVARRERFAATLSLSSPGRCGRSRSWRPSPLRAAHCHTKTPQHHRRPKTRGARNPHSRNKGNPRHYSTYSVTPLPSLVFVSPDSNHPFLTALVHNTRHMHACIVTRLAKPTSSLHVGLSTHRYIALPCQAISCISFYIVSFLHL